MLSIVESFVGKVIFNLLVLSYIPPPPHANNCAEWNPLIKKIKKCKQTIHTKRILFSCQIRKSHLLSLHLITTISFCVWVGGRKVKYPFILHHSTFELLSSYSSRKSMKYQITLSNQTQEYMKYTEGNMLIHSFFFIRTWFIRTSRLKLSKKLRTF